MKLDERTLVPLPDRGSAPTERRRSVRIELGSGRSVDVEEGGSEDSVTIACPVPGGTVELRVRLTDEGPVLEVDAASLQLRSPEIALEGERVRIAATEDIELDAGGSIAQRATGDHVVEAVGRSSHHARSVRVESELGNIDLEANDDVVVRGERIKLN